MRLIRTAPTANSGKFDSYRIILNKLLSIVDILNPYYGKVG